MINKFARSLTHLITHSQTLNLTDKYVQNEADTDIVIVIVNSSSGMARPAMSNKADLEHKHGSSED